MRKVIIAATDTNQRGVYYCCFPAAQSWMQLLPAWLHLWQHITSIQAGVGRGDIGSIQVRGGAPEDWSTWKVLFLLYAFLFMVLLWYKMTIVWFSDATFQFNLQIQMWPIRPLQVGHHCHTPFCKTKIARCLALYLAAKLPLGLMHSGR